MRASSVYSSRVYDVFVDGVLKQRVESIGNYVDTDSRMRSTTVSSVCRLVPERAERSTGWCRVVWLTHCAQKPYMQHAKTLGEGVYTWLCGGATQLDARAS